MNEVLAFLFLTMSAKFNLPQGLLQSVCYVETKHDVHAIHYDDGHGNSVGICQVKLSTARWLGFRGTEEQLMEPSVNIYYAAKYLAYQQKRYGNIEKSLVAYNQGSVRTIASTKYSQRVLRQWRQSERNSFKERSGQD